MYFLFFFFNLNNFNNKNPRLEPPKNPLDIDKRKAGAFASAFPSLLRGWDLNPKVGLHRAWLALAKNGKFSANPGGKEARQVASTLINVEAAFITSVGIPWATGWKEVNADLISPTSPALLLRGDVNFCLSS